MSKIPFLKLFLIVLASLVSGCKMDNTADKSTINADKIIEIIKSGKNETFVNKTITGNLDFTQITNNSNLESKGNFRTWIDASLTFINCTFKDSIIASRRRMFGKQMVNVFVTFNKNLSFVNCEFHREINFNETVFDGLTSFSACTFYKTAFFEGAFFRHKNNYFTDAVFRNQARFQRTAFIGDVDFLRSVFDGIVRFQNATFHQSAQFGAAQFNAMALFDNMQVNGRFICNKAEFKKDAVFNNSAFYSELELSEAKFSENLKIKNIKAFSKILLHKAQVKGTISRENAVIYCRPDTTKAKLPDDFNKSFNMTAISNLKNN